MFEKSIHPLFIKNWVKGNISRLNTAGWKQPAVFLWKRPLQKQEVSNIFAGNSFIIVGIMLPVIGKANSSVQSIGCL
jgi:hypothetical protein